MCAVKVRNAKLRNYLKSVGRQFHTLVTRVIYEKKYRKTTPTQKKLKKTTKKPNKKQIKKKTPLHN